MKKVVLFILLVLFALATCAQRLHPGPRPHKRPHVTFVVRYPTYPLVITFDRSNHSHRRLMVTEYEVRKFNDIRQAVARYRLIQTYNFYRFASPPSDSLKSTVEPIANDTLNINR